MSAQFLTRISLRARQVGRRQRERQVGAAVLDVGLNDDVDDDAGVGQRLKHLRLDPGLVGRSRQA